MKEEELDINFFRMKRSITQLARDLRKNQTETEKELWKHLRNRKLGGFKFTRQFPIVYGNNLDGIKQFFIVDFYCFEKKVAIELDGQIHNFQKNYDTEREAIIKEKGIKILRFKNEEINNINEVLDKILKELSPCTPSL